jgi:cyclic pyranopterin phosphate synthase
VPLSKVEIDVQFEGDKSTFSIRSVTSTEAQTGVEMEAFTAATIAGLTIYDMIKAVDPAASVGPFCLEQKTGGRHGPWSKPDE